MTAESLVKSWFQIWETGNFKHLPISRSFKHHSPYGTIEGKEAYVRLVEANKDKFLGHRFEIHDTLFQTDRACVRYTAIQGDFKLNVSEWHYIKEGLIDVIYAYYNIEGEISADRELNFPDQ